MVSCPPVIGVDADFSLKLEEDEQVAEEETALQQAPKDAGVAAARVPRRVDGQEIPLSCPTAKKRDPRCMRREKRSGVGRERIRPLAARVAPTQLYEIDAFISYELGGE